MINNLLLATRTKAQLEQLLDTPTHALMIVGDKGSGKETIAKSFIAASLKVPFKKLPHHPFYRVVLPINNTVSIEQIREVHKFLSLRTTGRGVIRRAIIVVDAHAMTTEAQNALLKILEEPPDDSMLVLTVAGDRTLKPTVYSRTQQVIVVPPSLLRAEKYFSKKAYSTEAVRRSYLLSSGRVGLLNTLLESQDHSLASMLALAKELLGSDSYNRLRRVEELLKQKLDITDLLFALRRVINTALHNAIASSKANETRRLLKSLKAVYEAEAALKHSPNNKVLLVNLLLKL